MVEVTGTVEVEYDGEITINMNELDRDKAEELLLALMSTWFIQKADLDRVPEVKIPVCFAFETEVTLEHEPMDYP